MRGMRCCLIACAGLLAAYIALGCLLYVGSHTRYAAYRNPADQRTLYLPQRRDARVICPFGSDLELTLSAWADTAAQPLAHATTWLAGDRAYTRFKASSLVELVDVVPATGYQRHATADSIVRFQPDP